MDQGIVGKVTSGSLVRVKLWTPEGRIVYSDEHRLIGASYPLAMTSSGHHRTHGQAHLTSIFQTIGVTAGTQAALWAERNRLRGGGT
jgi:hypothetical protein